MWRVGRTEVQIEPRVTPRAVGVSPCRRSGCRRTIFAEACSLTSPGGSTATQLQAPQSSPGAAGLCFSCCRHIPFRLRSRDLVTRVRHRPCSRDVPSYSVVTLGQTIFPVCDKVQKLSNTNRLARDSLVNILSRILWTTCVIRVAPRPPTDETENLFIITTRSPAAERPPICSPATRLGASPPTSPSCRSC